MGWGEHPEPRERTTTEYRLVIRRTGSDRDEILAVRSKRDADALAEWWAKDHPHAVGRVESRAVTDWSEMVVGRPVVTPPGVPVREAELIRRTPGRPRLTYPTSTS